MTEAYWLTDDFKAIVDGLDEPDAIKDPSRQDEIFDNQPFIYHELVPEWYWLDATETDLKINVHQSYARVAEAARVGGSLFRSQEQAVSQSAFTVRNHKEEAQWKTFSLDLEPVFQPIADDTIMGLTADADQLLIEFDSIIQNVDYHRFNTRETTTQLIAPFIGSLSLGGSFSAAARRFIALKYSENDKKETERLHYVPASRVVQSISTKLIGSVGLANVAMFSDGRFVSNTGLAMGTGSLEVFPLYMDEQDETRGYQYSSHNLDSPLMQLWALTGVARLIGDAHRHYADISSRDGDSGNNAS